MTENTNSARVSLGEDELERRMFALIETGDIHFPKGALRPGDEAMPRAGAFELLTRLTSGFPKLFLSAALAYMLAVVVSLPLYRALFPLQTVPETVPPPAVAAPPAAPPLGSARRLELGAGTTRAEGVAHHVTLDANDAFVVLSFLAPIRRAPGVHYQATITDHAGRRLAPPQKVQSVDELGNFVLVCRSDLFSSGDYQLTVSETSSPAPALAGLHRFSFHVSRPRD